MSEPSEPDDERKAVEAKGATRGMADSMRLGSRHRHAPDEPPEAWGPARRAALKALAPIDRFLRVQAASGVVLLATALVALLWANSPLSESYEHLWHTELHLGIGDFATSRSLHWVINDGLMAIFFFVVGLEIRRELHDGELSEWRRAALPATAALGGMVVPAAIYVVLNGALPGAPRGWGVPMATDIAFAVGVLALLGERVSPALRVLLLALAIIDDIGAILIIAVFYSGGLDPIGLLVTGGGVGLLLVMQRIGIRAPLVYVVPGLVVWTGLVRTGIHPTIAGVLVGLLTPVRSWFGRRGFVAAAQRMLDEIWKAPEQDDEVVVPKLEHLNAARREAVPPATRLNVVLNPWVAFGVMPLFALANAGVALDQVSLGERRGQLVLAGIVIGLFIGKPLGIAGLGTLAVKLGIATLPRGVDWRGLLIVGLVGGIGFTMSLFIGGLAFEPGSPELAAAKLAVLIGSLAAGLAGLALGRVLLPASAVEGAARTAQEAESSTEL